MSRVLLVNPRSTYVHEIAQKCYPPLNLLYLAAVLRQAGHTVRVLEANAFCLSDEAVAQAVADERPDLVGFALYSEVLKQVRGLTRLTKRAHPATKIVLGGPHASAVPGDVLRDFPEVDFVLRHEAEVSLCDLCAALDRGAPLDNLRGLSFRDGDRAIHNPDIGTRPDVETVPFPARDLVEEAFRRRRYYTVMVRARPVDTLMTSRGCPFQCGFCYNRNYKYRGRSAESVIQELLTIRERGIRDVEIVDDNFTANRERALRIFDLIVREGIDVSFRIKSRVNAVDEELLKKARRAGVYQVSYGMESGSQRILDAMEKRIRPEDSARACDLTKRLGLAVHSSWIIGYPGETRETISETIDFAAAIRPTTANFAILRPYPETRAYAEAKETGQLVGEWSPETEDLPWVRLPWVASRVELGALLKKALRRVYYRPHYAWQFGREIVRHANWTLARYAVQELGKQLRPGR